MNRREVLGSLGSVSLTGCLRLSSSSEDRGQETEKGLRDTEHTTDLETETRETIDSAPQSDEIEDYPIGLDAGGVNSYLVDNHLNTLAATSFTNHFRSTNLTDSTTKLSRVSHIDGPTALVEQKPDITMYVTPDSKYWRHPGNGNATYGQMPGSFNYKRTAMLVGLRPLITAGSWNPPERIDGDGFEITADGFDKTGPLQELWWFGGRKNDKMRSFTAEGHVTEEGVISRLDVDYQFVWQERDRLLRHEVRYRVNDIGDVSVFEPDWHQTAKDRAPSVVARITDDRQFIEVQHRDGNPILPETFIGIKAEEPREWVATGETIEPIKAETTVYIWAEDDNLQLQQDTKPSTGSARLLDEGYTFEMKYNGAQYFPLIELG